MTTMTFKGKPFDKPKEQDEQTLTATTGSVWPSKRWKHLFRSPWIIWWLFLCQELQKPLAKDPTFNDVCRVIIFLIVLFSPWWLKDSKTPNVES